MCSLLPASAPRRRGRGSKIFFDSPLLNPPPQGGRKLVWSAVSTAFPPPLRGKGQGGGYRRMIPACRPRMRDTLERTRRKPKNGSGRISDVNRSKALGFAGRPPSGHTSSISSALRQDSLSNWMVGNMRMPSRPTRAEQLGFKHADIELFGFGTMMSWKTLTVCSTLLRRILRPHNFSSSPRKRRSRMTYVLGSRFRGNDEPTTFPIRRETRIAKPDA